MAIPVLAVQLPHPAGLLLAGAVVGVLCVLYQLAAPALRSEPQNWELVLGGVLFALALSLVAAFLAVLGAPTF